MKLIPTKGYLTGEWVVLKDNAKAAVKFKTLEEKSGSNVDVALRIVNRGSNTEVEVGDVVYTGIQFNVDAINPFGQIIPEDSIFAVIDTEGREAQNYVEWANE